MACGVVLDLVMVVDVLLGFGGMSGGVIHIREYSFSYHFSFILFFVNFYRLAISLLLLLRRIWNSISANPRSAFLFSTRVCGFLVK